MDIIVIGAAGFIGSHLVDVLLSQGHSVIGLDNLSTGRRDNLFSAMRYAKFQFQVHDVRTPLPCWAPLVFNLACPASPVHYAADPIGTLETSVVGTLRMIEAARKRRFILVHASTSEVYGDPDEHPQVETYWGNVNPQGPRSCYDEGKRAAESLLYDARDLFPARIARIFNTYGPRMRPDDGRVIPAFIQAAVHQRPLNVHGTGDHTRSFCYISDLLNGLLRLSWDGLPSGLPFNLGNDEEITIHALAELILHLAGAPKELLQHQPTNLNDGDPRRRRPDLQRAKGLLGYEPQVKLEQGLCMLLAEARAQAAAAAPPSTPAETTAETATAATPKPKSKKKAAGKSSVKKRAKSQGSKKKRRA